MALKITTLSENTADNLGLIAEWGLSILIESDDANILLDTGQTISVGHDHDVFRIPCLDAVHAFDNSSVQGAPALGARIRNPVDTGRRHWQQQALCFFPRLSPGYSIV